MTFWRNHPADHGELNDDLAPHQVTALLIASSTRRDVLRVARGPLRL